MKRITVAVLALLLVSTSAVALRQDPAKAVKGHLLDYGIIKGTNQQKRYEIPGQPGRYAILGRMEIIQKTDKIPLQQGTVFGIAWAITGLQEDEIEVLYAVEHPEMTLENGKKTRSGTEKMWHRVVDGTAKSMDGYILNHDYELLPGKWTVSVTYRDIKISKTFTVSEEYN